MCLGEEALRRPLRPGVRAALPPPPKLIFRDCGPSPPSRSRPCLDQAFSLIFDARPYYALMTGQRPSPNDFQATKWAARAGDTRQPRLLGSPAASTTACAHSNKADLRYSIAAAGKNRPPSPPPGHRQSVSGQSCSARGLPIAAALLASRAAPSRTAVAACSWRAVGASPGLSSRANCKRDAASIKFARSGRLSTQPQAHKKSFCYQDRLPANRVYLLPEAVGSCCYHPWRG